MPTRAPIEARPIADALPIPPVPPVTSTVLPVIDEVATIVRFLSVSVRRPTSLDGVFGRRECSDGDASDGDRRRHATEAARAVPSGPTIT